MTISGIVDPVDVNINYSGSRLWAGVTSFYSLAILTLRGGKQLRVFKTLQAYLTIRLSAPLVASPVHEQASSLPILHLDLSEGVRVTSSRFLGALLPLCSSNPESVLQTMADYTFPPFHSFPPSYTRQPVDATRAKQTELWCDLIRDYCRVYRIFWLDVSKAWESSLFHNPAIDRRLSDEDIRYFLGELVARGDAQWDPDRKRCLVFWRRPSEWGELIYQWVEKTGCNGELLTVHELRKGTRSEGYEFHNLEIDTTLKALQALEALGKCVIVHGDSEDALGVKFVN